tara:strand:+ start:366 stop:479 length:114 start_codon:yes stop_codon:yes gene_type:complete
VVLELDKHNQEQLILVEVLVEVLEVLEVLMGEQVDLV